MKLETDAIDVIVGTRTVLRRQSFSADAGETVAIVGPSGAGKTTLLAAAGLLQRVSAGRVVVGGRDATGWSDRRRRAFWRDHAAFLFQDYGVIESESVGYNVRLSERSSRAARRRSRQRLDEVLEHVGLAGRDGDPASTLSGGEKQRVGFARALFRRADVVLADEPTASLDAPNRALVRDLLRLEADRGATVVISTHDLDLARECSRVVELEHVGEARTPGILRA